MSHEILGVMRLDGDRGAVRFERWYDTSPSDLWSALTEPARLARWFARVEGDLSEGGAFKIVFDEDDPSQRADGSILECRPPEHLRISWVFADEGESFVVANLVPDRSGTLLILEHTGLPVAQTTGYGAGWEAYLEALQADLEGTPGRGPKWDQRWQELKPAYDAALS